MNILDKTTICAIATPAGGAIGIIRISGPKALAITSKLFQPIGNMKLEQKAGGTLTYGTIVDPDTHEVIDEVLVSLFRAPHSYTGEDSTEISCHGSHYILSKVIQLLLANGCTLAKPGEYTQRAFLNGKMDLSQAEAVADLIASNTAANHRMAVKQMRGTFSNELRDLRDKLLHITSLLELELDFSDHEELEFASRKDLLELANLIKHRISKLCQSFRLGNALKRGIPIAIVGETNAGKSTLLNALVGEQRALVSDIHGTTRDTVEETVVVDDMLIRFIDTAGIRATTDKVEKMGIERTYTKMQEADLVFWLIDSTRAEEQYKALCTQILGQDKSIILIFNKIDLLSPTRLEVLKNKFSSLAESPTKVAHLLPKEKNTVQVTEVEEQRIVCPQKVFDEKFQGIENLSHSRIYPIYISAQSATDIEALQHLLSATLRVLQSEMIPESDTIISNARHYEALSKAQIAIERVIDGLISNLSCDFISQDLRETIHHLGEIVGEISSDSVLHNIFRKFCIGK